MNKDSDNKGDSVHYRGKKT